MKNKIFGLLMVGALVLISCQSGGSEASGLDSSGQSSRSLVSSGTDASSAQISSMMISSEMDMPCPEAPPKEKHPLYDFVGKEVEGLRRVTLNGKYGYIDAEENVVIPIQYAFSLNFYEGIALVYLQSDYYWEIKNNGYTEGSEFSINRHAYIDKTGKILYEAPYPYYMETAPMQLFDPEHLWNNDHVIAIFPEQGEKKEYSIGSMYTYNFAGELIWKQIPEGETVVATDIQDLEITILDKDAFLQKYGSSE